MGQITFRALGSTMLIVAEALCETELEVVPRWFAAWEQSLSRFLPTSELQSLNTHGMACVSPLLWEALQHGLEVAAITDGLITPTVLPALLAAGYSRSFDEGVEPSPTTPISQIPDWRTIQCIPANRMVTLPPDCLIDLGGTAKGWLINRALAQLRCFGPVLVDAGGDIGVTGPQTDGLGWPIEVAHPWLDREPIALAILPSGGIATSGRDYRRWQSNRGWQHHLIDPRTGYPSTSDVLSATVIAPDAATADWAAKVVLLLGSRTGLQWLDQHPDLAGIVVLDDGTWLSSRRFSQFCWPQCKEDV